MELTCKKCDFKTTTRTDLQHHLENDHKDAMEICTHCGYETKYVYRLKAHLNEVHYKIQDKHCPICDFKTYRREGLKRHMDSVHHTTEDTASGSKEMRR